MAKRWNKPFFLKLEGRHSKMAPFLVHLVQPGKAILEVVAMSPERPGKSLLRRWEVHLSERKPLYYSLIG